MRRALFLTVAVTGLMVSSSHAFLFSYPRDGHFKQQSGTADLWYYRGDANWTVKAPDKWQHMMGSYAGTEVFGLLVDRRLAGGIVFGLGVLKEVEDGFREGWSIRDIMMDAAGVSASLLNSDKCKLWCDWGHDSVQLKISIILK